MALNVIGTGFGRTGTLSLKVALEHLGIGPCHHMGELYEQHWQAAFWAAAARGEPVDWRHLLAGYRACLDWPSAHFWRQVAAEFPQARAIHTIRPAEDWWDSYEQTILRFITAGAEQPDGIRAYNQRLADVCAELPPERLLVFEVRDGWEPLCRFLDLPIPETAFPRLNDRADFWSNFALEA